MELIQEWVRNIFMFILSLTFIELLLPSSKIKPYIKFIFSMTIMATILAPLVSLLE